MLEAVFASVHTIFPDSFTYFIPASAVVSIIFAVWLWIRVSAVRVAPATHTRSENGREYLLEEEQRGEDEVSWEQTPVTHLAPLTLRYPLCGVRPVFVRFVPSHSRFFLTCRLCKRLLIFRMLLLRVPTAFCSLSTSTWLFLW